MQPAEHQRLSFGGARPWTARPMNPKCSPGGFWQPPTVDELAAEQGITAPQQIDEMIGAAAGLWDDDEDFHRFLQGIHDRRLEQRGGW